MRLDPLPSPSRSIRPFYRRKIVVIQNRPHQTWWINSKPQTKWRQLGCLRLQNGRSPETHSRRGCSRQNRQHSDSPIWSHNPGLICSKWRSLQRTCRIIKGERPWLRINNKTNWRIRVTIAQRRTRVFQISRWRRWRRWRLTSNKQWEVVSVWKKYNNICPFLSFSLKEEK